MGKKKRVPPWSSVPAKLYGTNWEKKKIVKMSAMQKRGRSNDMVEGNDSHLR